MEKYDHFFLKFVAKNGKKWKKMSQKLRVPVGNVPK